MLVAKHLAEPVQRTRVDCGQAFQQLDQALPQRQRRAIEQSECPRDAAFGRGRNGLELRVGGLAPGRGGGSADDLVLRKRSQGEPPATRPDGRQRSAWRVTHQEQQRARWRFFQRL